MPELDRSELIFELVDKAFGSEIRGASAHAICISRQAWPIDRPSEISPRCCTEMRHSVFRCSREQACKGAIPYVLTPLRELSEQKNR
jgi:hypothetical protein